LVPGIGGYQCRDLPGRCVVSMCRVEAIVDPLSAGGASIAETIQTSVVNGKVRRSPGDGNSASQ
jgi:hypothetical protein